MKSSDFRAKASGHVLLSLLGLLLAIPGAIGTLLLSAMLFRHLPPTAVSAPFVLHQVIFETLWWLVFVALFALGISLLVSGVRRVQQNLVPGPTLYIMGASLMAIALMLGMYGQWLQAAVAALVGMVLMWLEWRHDII